MPKTKVKSKTKSRRKSKSPAKKKKTARKTVKKTTKKTTRVSKSKKTVAKKKYHYAYGRRKSAVATIRVYKGKGQDIINDKKIKEVYSSPRSLKDIYRPFDITETKDKYYFSVIVKGGGKRGQLEAIQLALSRALVKIDSEFKKELKKESFLTVDSRLKERKKPGLRKARKKQQFSKR